MRILFVSDSFPGGKSTNVHGIFKRMGMFLDAIKEIAELDMLFYVSPKINTSPSSVSQFHTSLSRKWKFPFNLSLCSKNDIGKINSKWQQYGAGIISFFKQMSYIGTSGTLQLKAFENLLIRKPDAIFVHRLSSMCPLLLTHKKLPSIFLDLDDIEHVAFTRSIGQPPRWRAKPLLYIQIPALLWGERRAINMADSTFVCSELDRNYLTRYWRLNGIVTVPNAISIPKLTQLTEEPTLLFLGYYGFRPNIIAAEFLIEKVWPHIHQSMPTARLIIAGDRPNKIRFYHSDIPGVEFTGFVDDLNELYSQSRVVCSPIFSGGGSRVKVIEAAAFGKPIVSTRIGAEGIEMNDGEHLLVRDDPEAFSKACLSLLKNINLCRQLGNAARDVAIRYYDRTNIVKLIQNYIRV